MASFLELVLCVRLVNSWRYSRHKYVFTALSLRFADIVLHDGLTYAAYLRGGDVSESVSASQKSTKYIAIVLPACYAYIQSYHDIYKYKKSKPNHETSSLPVILDNKSHRL